MKHYLIADDSSAGAIVNIDNANAENTTVCEFNEIYVGMRNVYLIPEDGMFRNEKVKKGDIIIKTYSFEKIPTRYFVIRNKEFSKHLFERDAIINRRTEEIPSGTNCAME